MRIIGVTGGVGSGKSELLRYIETHYRAYVLRSDEAAHAVSLVPGGSVYPQLVALLEAGNQAKSASDHPLLLPDCTIDRKEMAARIFGDPELLSGVNALVHPAVRVYIEEAIQKAADAKVYDYFFLEAALLIEEGYRKVVDSMWYIHADEAVRRQRLAKSRGYSKEKTDAIMKSQLSEREFYENADVVIDNSGSLADAFRQIDAALANMV